MKINGSEQIYVFDYLNGRCPYMFYPENNFHDENQYHTCEDMFVIEELKGKKNVFIKFHPNDK